MIPIFSASNVKTLDSQEIAIEGITSFELMHRASSALYSKLTELLATTDVHTVAILASGGNNGGDALCVADMLRVEHKTSRPLEIVIYYIKVSDRQTSDFIQAYDKVKNYIKIVEISTVDGIEKMHPILKRENLCVVDGLLGSGINRVVKKDSF